MSATFTSNESFIVEHCCRQGCGVAFGLHRAHYQELQADHRRDFYCPNGHSMVYAGKTDAQKLKDAEAREVALKDQASAAIRDAEAVRFALLRDRTRFANGVCPCCNRSFEAVARHIKSQHPDYDVTAIKQPSTDKFRCSCGRTFTSLRGLRTHQGHHRKDGWDRPGIHEFWSHLTKV